MSGPSPLSTLIRERTDRLTAAIREVEADLSELMDDIATDKPPGTDDAQGQAAAVFLRLQEARQGLALVAGAVP